MNLIIEQIHNKQIKELRKEILSMKNEIRVLQDHLIQTLDQLLKLTKHSNNIVDLVKK